MKRQHTRRVRTRKRIELLDELRGFCLVLMVMFHAFYLIGYTFRVPLGRDLFDFFQPAEPFFAALFIIISGICCRLSRSNLKRGLLIAGAAVLVSACLYCAVWWRMLPDDSVIWFGILHFLAVSILLYTLSAPVVLIVPWWLGFVVSTLLFFLCWHIPADAGSYFGWPGLFTIPVPAAQIDSPFLYPLGLCSVSSCSDYFPLIPWFFCFLAGVYLGDKAGKGRFPKWTYTSRVPVLALIGRQSLPVYLLHQPTLYLLCEVIRWVGSLLS